MDSDEPCGCDESKRLREGIQQLLVHLNTAVWRKSHNYKGPDREELVDMIVERLQSLLYSTTTRLEKATKALEEE